MEAQNEVAPALDQSPEDLPVEPVKEEETNDYEIVVTLRLNDEEHRVTICYEDGVPTLVKFGSEYYSKLTIPAALIRQIQNAMMSGTGQSFKATGLALGQLQGANVAPYPGVLGIGRQRGPSIGY